MDFFFFHFLVKKKKKGASYRPSNTVSLGIGGSNLKFDKKTRTIILTKPTDPYLFIKKGIEIYSNSSHQIQTIHQEVMCTDLFYDLLRVSI